MVDLWNSAAYREKSDFSFLFYCAQICNKFVGKITRVKNQEKMFSGPVKYAENSENKIDPIGHL